MDTPYTDSSSAEGESDSGPSSQGMATSAVFMASSASCSRQQINSSLPVQPLSASQESSIRMFVDSQDGSVTDDDSGDNFVKEKVNRGTITEREVSKPPKCKYCIHRLSKLRKLEKMKSLKASHNSATPQQSVSPKLPRKDKGCQTPASLFDKAEMTHRELRSLAMILGFRDGKPLRTETFCKCVLHGIERNCRCGEEDKYFEWGWDPRHRGTATGLQERGRLVLFHQDYSCGTTAIRGQKAMEKDQHFWEIKMTTPVYGTDMMVGVGTSNVELNRFHNTFCSMLGYDMDSWGISYDGRVQHGGRKREFCSRYGQGAIIGIHLDMWHGTLSFFKNRQSLGVAFRGLRGRTLYPMACSTAARSGMRVISSRSFPTSLQFLCCQKLREFVPAHLSVLDAISMPPGLRTFLANNMTWLLHVPPTSPLKPKVGFICPICMPLKGVLEGCTDDEEDSSDEDRIDHIHDMIHIGDSDEETDQEDSDDFSDKSSPRRGHPSLMVAPSIASQVSPGSSSSSTSTGSSASSSSLAGTSDTGRTVLTRRTLHGVKKSRLEFNRPQSPAEEEDSNDEEGEVEEKETTEEEVSSGAMSDTQTGESMEFRDGQTPLIKLGKRKRT